MSKMIDGETLNAEITITKQTGTKIKLATGSKYVPKAIELTVNAQSTTPEFDGGAISSKVANVTANNLTVSSSNTSGVFLTPVASAVRDAVLYDGAVNGWVNINDNAEALAASNQESWNGTTSYVTGVSLSNSKSFKVTVPNYPGGAATFDIAVSSTGTVTITSNVPWTDGTTAITDGSGNTVYFRTY